jgi:O-acetyl-ADP-ribose deacetylase (regulator of RNase III)/uncharacterized protein YwgA
VIATQTRNVTVRQGDLFESAAQTLVNTVNTVGIMGKGIALGFKQRFPEMYEDYRARCERGEVQLGQPYIYAPVVPPRIINFPTKAHWRAQSRLTDIVEGLRYLAERAHDWGVESLAVPPLGCGEGGLEWRVVGPTMYEHLAGLGIPVTLYAPFNAPQAELQIEYLEEQLAEIGHGDGPSLPASRVPAAAVALVEVLARLQANPHQPPIGRIFFQKLAYFGTERGLPTGLVFEPKSFGPFSAGLKRLTNRLINNGLVDEDPSAGNRIAVSVGPSYAKAQRAYADELARFEPTINALVDLFSRMTSRKAELAATVHFAAKQLWLANGKQPVAEIDVLSSVKEWKARRKPEFTEAEMALTIRNLGVLGWMTVEPSPELPAVEDMVP